MNIALDRRLKRVEEKLAPPKLSEVGAMLCKLMREKPEIAAGLGIDVDKAVRTGDLWGQFPRDVLKELAERMRERMRAMTSAG